MIMGYSEAYLKTSKSQPPLTWRYVAHRRAVFSPTAGEKQQTRQGMSTGDEAGWLFSHEKAVELGAYHVSPTNSRYFGGGF